MKNILFLVVLTVVVVYGVFVCMFMTDKAEFKSPDGKITATFTEFDKTLTFSGKGELSGSYDWIEKDPHYLDKTAKAVGIASIKKIVFEPGITSIKAGEFCDWPIGMRNCRNLKKVIFKGDIDRIGSFNFFAYYKLSKVIFDGDCKSIGFFSFGLCDIGKTADIPKGCDAKKYSFYKPKSPFSKPSLSDKEWDYVIKELEAKTSVILSRLVP